MGARGRPRAPIGMMIYTRECVAVVFVVRVRAPVQETAEMVPQSPRHGPLVRNRRRLGDVGRDTTQRFARGRPRALIGMMIYTRERQQVDVVRERQLSQHVERSIGHAALGWVGQRLRQDKQPRPAHRAGRAWGAMASARAAFTRPSEKATSMYSMSV